MKPSLDQFREPDQEWPQPRKDADAFDDDDLTYEQRLENSIKTLEKIMNEKEMRELDAWIAEHVMGLSMEEQFGNPDNPIRGTITPPNYTTNPAAAMLVLEKCLTMADELEIRLCYDCEYKVFDWSKAAKAETLPLAICLFAKKLFSS